MSRLLGLADPGRNYALRLTSRGSSVAVGDPMSFSSALSELAEALVDTLAPFLEHTEPQIMHLTA